MSSNPRALFNRHFNLLLAFIALSFFFPYGTAEAGVFDWCAKLVYKKAPRPEVAYVDFYKQKIPVPVGLKPEAFSEWLEAIKQSDFLQALVVFGSRTHFSFGYLPYADSDLDTFVFFLPGSPLGALTALGRHSHLTSHRVSLIHPHCDFNQAIREREFLFPHTLEEERRIFNWIESRMFNWLPIWGRDHRTAYRELLYVENPYISQKERELLERGAFSLFTPGPRILSINKEAIILLREGPDNQSQRAMLKDSGFINIFTL